MSSKIGLKAKISVAAVSTALVMMGGANKATAVSSTLWSSGDPDGMVTLANGINTSRPDSMIYQAFNAPTTWNITDLVSYNFLSSFPGSVTQANWEIRSGVTSGNSGTLIRGGTLAPATGTTATNGATEVDVPVNLSLNPGTYFLAVAPVSPATGIGRSFVATTTGTNAVGTTPTGNNSAFVNSSGSGQNYTPASMYVTSPRFAAAIRGNAAAPVPFEFSPSLGLVVLGAWGAFYKFKQAKQKSGL